MAVSTLHRMLDIARPLEAQRRRDMTSAGSSPSQPREVQVRRLPSRGFFSHGGQACGEGSETRSVVNAVPHSAGEVVAASAAWVHPRPPGAALSRWLRVVASSPGARSRRMPSSLSPRGPHAISGDRDVPSMRAAHQALARVNAAVRGELAHRGSSLP